MELLPRIVPVTFSAAAACFHCREFAVDPESLVGSGLVTNDRWNWATREAVRSSSADEAVLHMTRRAHRDLRPGRGSRVLRSRGSRCLDE
jgi:hypothetical protein